MYYLYLLLFYGTQLFFDLFFNDTFIYYFFYVIVKERLAIEFIVLNCSINQKTHNNMSVNVFPLSHQVGTIGDTHVQVIHAFPQRCLSAILLSILLLLRHSNRPITMVHSTTPVTIVMPKAIHRQTCPACSLRSILLLNLMILLHFDMIKVV